MATSKKSGSIMSELRFESVDLKIAGRVPAVPLDVILLQILWEDRVPGDTVDCGVIAACGWDLAPVEVMFEGVQGVGGAMT